MNTKIITHVTRGIIRGVTKHSPTILTSGAAVGVVGTAVLAVKGYKRAQEKIIEHEMDSELLIKGEAIFDEGSLQEITPCHFRQRTKWEEVKLTWSCYLPSVFIGMATIAAMVEANSINLKRNLALATAYSLSEEAAKEFKDKVAETIGQRKVEKIEHEIAQDRLNQSTLPNYIPTIGYGSVLQLYRDHWSGQFFYSYTSYIEKMEHVMNNLIKKEESASINDWYELLGLQQTEFGDCFGWMYNGDPSEDIFHIRWDHCWAPDGETHCGVVKFDADLLP